MGDFDHGGELEAILPSAPVISTATAIICWQDELWRAGLSS